MKRLALLGLCWALLPCWAEARDFAPETVVSVLVDLSATWHNGTSKAYNDQLLESVGTALSSAAIVLPKPISIRYHAIGQATLDRPSLCRIDYRPNILGFSSPGVESDSTRFQAYLVQKCPLYILSNRPEPVTEIAAAIQSSLQATAMVSNHAVRVMLILSDFKEETKVHLALLPRTLAGVRIIMLWRTLPEDRRNPAELDKRIALWKAYLAGHGAKMVSAFADDTAIYSPAEFAALIEGDD